MTVRVSRRPSGSGCSSGFTRGATSDGGTGLGLAIARWAVELHGGTIEVLDAAPGCRIRVTIPPPAGRRLRDDDGPGGYRDDAWRRR